MKKPQHRMAGGAGAPREVVGCAPDISALEILLAVPPDEDADMLARELLRTRSNVRRIWPLPSHLPEPPDVVFCELTSHLQQGLPWIPGQPLAALVVVTKATQTPQLKLLRNCAPHAVLHRPFTTGTVLTSLAIARAQFRYEQRLRARIDKLDETLRSFRAVERAKNILMAERNLEEDEAYHFMRRRAMSHRVSVSAVATAIIDSHDILG
ncbi:MAG: ANTAR domain-containing protein [Bradyrhizobiaceae bacterium]|nr:ANTAR domain-containing protein [Bradyrhizobiaceae bacterium]